MTRRKTWRLALPLCLTLVATTAGGAQAVAKAPDAAASAPAGHRGHGGGHGGGNAIPPATFAAAAEYETGTRPWATTYGDFDGDGRVDAVTGNGGGSISVFRNLGGGTFGERADYAAPALPYFLLFDLVAVDFNNDGHLDIAVSGGNPVGNVVLYANNGDGTFAEPTSVPMGFGPNQIAVGDLNRDGKQDLLTANNFSADVSVRLGRGNGTFGPERRYQIGPGPQGLAVADVNRDHIPDILTGNFGRLEDSLSVLLGRGDGTFRPARNYAAGLSVNDVAVADFNRDGLPDVALPEFVSNQVEVLLGRPGGRFGQPTAYPIGTGVNEMSLGDFNADGKIDIATTVSPDNNRDPSAPPPPAGTKGAGVSILLGNGDGTFGGMNVLAVTGAVASVRAVDVTNDGLPDLVGANLNTQSLAVWLNTTPR
ncbi:VCBS repeat-containing protein [Plantactinospora sp. KBS50]|uniref:FG-GAP repeat domain-containing protein n=1 Tax=Plantactinospora sp. KBS50 TaxID=2024580 RepID=UPI000BAA9EF0|nr:VCBS repeat-containing protein [Plantactinospora sp. KBS50]ASW56764.1 hypothetical protein CIK06_25315 [Plantactinospora sp. KBS50]